MTTLRVKSCKQLLLRICILPGRFLLKTTGLCMGVRIHAVVTDYSIRLYGSISKILCLVARKGSQAS